MSPTVIDLSESYKPTDTQSMAHTASELYLLYGGAMGGGKSVLLCNEAIQLSLDHPFNRGFLGRWENKTFKNTTFLTLQQFLSHKIVARHHLSEQYYDLINGSRIYYGGLKPSATGSSMDRLKRAPELGWFAIDEASEVPEEFFLMLASRLRLDIPNIHYRGILASNPEPGWLRKRFIEQQLPDHKYIPALPKDNPHLPSDYEGRLRELFPDEWVKRYLSGNWDVLMEGNYVFPYAWVKAAVERSLDAEGPCEFGLDVAGGGRDETVLAARWGAVARLLYTSHESSTMNILGEVGIFKDRHQPETIRIDAVGIGKGPYDRAVELNWPVEAYIAGSEAKDKKRFINRRAEDHWNFRDRLEAGTADLPDDPVLISQFCGIEYEIQSDTKIKIESKKGDTGTPKKPSPDRPEAVIQAFAEKKKIRSGSVFVTSGKRKVRRGSDESYREQEIEQGKRKQGKGSVSFV